MCGALWRVTSGKCKGTGKNAVGQLVSPPDLSTDRRKLGALRSALIARSRTQGFHDMDMLPCKHGDKADRRAVAQRSLPQISSAWAPWLASRYTAMKSKLVTTRTLAHARRLGPGLGEARSGLFPEPGETQHSVWPGQRLCYTCDTIVAKKTGARR